MRMAIFAVALLFTFGCDQDPAKSVKIIPRPASVPGATETAFTDSKWHPAGCPPAKEEHTGPGTFKASGPCTFDQTNNVKCIDKLDDFFVMANRVGPNGEKISIYINVEKYHGPGDYLLAQAHINLESGGLLYRWTSDDVSIKVGEDLAFVELPKTLLDAEPVMNICPPRINPDGSYSFPCDSKRIKSPVDGTQEILSGRLNCTKED